MTPVKIAALCAGVLIAGCSDRVVDVQVPTSHPANADAAAAPLPEPSTTLVIRQEPDANGVLLIPRLQADPAPRVEDEHAHQHHGGSAPDGDAGTHEAPAPSPPAPEPPSGSASDDDHTHHLHGDATATPAGAPAAPVAAPASTPPAPAGDAPASTAELYWCKHHHDIVQPGPGKCPTCGMTLVPKPADGAGK